MLTYKQYYACLNGLDAQARHNLHHQYYSQFVNDRIINLVLSEFTVGELKESYAQDIHMNTLSLQRWDRISYVWMFISKSLIKDLGAWTSSCNAICILKTAARIIIDQP
jgi:hypothetical protein